MLINDIKDAVKKYIVYNIKVIGSDGNPVTITQTGTLRIPIANDYDQNCTVGKVIGNNGASGNIGTIRDGYLCIDTSAFKPYAVVENYNTSTSAAGLEDGVYTVGWFIRHKSVDGGSMSDNAFSKPATMVVKDGKVRLELEQKGVDLGVLHGYLTRMSVIHLDADENIEEGAETVSAIPYSYLKAVKQDNMEVTDAPIDNALVAAIEVAQATRWEESTPESWEESGIDTALEEAKKANGSTDAAEKEAARKNLQTAIDYLTDHYLSGSKYADGLYTAKASLKDSGAEITSAKVKVNADNTTNIVLNTSDIKEVAYYSFDEGVRGYALADEIIDADKNVTGFTYTLPPSMEVSGGAGESVYESLAVKYIDKEGNTHNTWLNLTEFAAQGTLDTTALDEILVTADEILAENSKNPGAYDAEEIAALQKARAKAAAALVNPMTIQSEIYAKMNEINAMIAGLTKRANTEELQSVLEKAKAIENDNYSGWSDLQSIIKQAEELLANENISQTSVDSMVISLKSAIVMLDDAIDKSELRSLVAQAEKLLENDYKDCTEETRAYFEASINAAKAILNNAGASQAEVNKQINNLVAVSKAMVEKADDSILYDGVYNINGKIVQEDGKTDSMSNAALDQMQVVVENNKPVEVRIRFHFLTTSLGGAEFTGYLGNMKYFAGYRGGTTPTGKTPTQANVILYYADDVTDVNGKKFVLTV